MIAAWFMRFGSLTLQDFSDVDDLADTLVMLDDASTSTYDQWGSFNDAVDTITGRPIPDADIDAAKARAEAENATAAAEYVPPECSHRIFLKDAKGRMHLFRSIRTSDVGGVDSLAFYKAQLAGLLADGRAEIRPAASKETRLP